jgi:hypothetical protein
MLEAPPHKRLCEEAAVFNQQMATCLRPLLNDLPASYCEAIQLSD